jgi:hypothetical protein
MFQQRDLCDRHGHSTRLSIRGRVSTDEGSRKCSSITLPSKGITSSSQNGNHGRPFSTEISVRWLLALTTER